MLNILLMLFIPVWGAGLTIAQGAILTGSAASTADGCRVLADPEPPPYYQIALVSTRKVPGAGQASGVGDVSYKATPFGIGIGVDGSYVYNLDLHIERLAPAKKGRYVAWVSTPDIKQIKRLGPLGETHHIKGVVDWNKFLVIITLETDLSPGLAKWKGPVVLRGVSRSGFMHTMAGHGPYESEPCAVYGY